MVVLAFSSISFVGIGMMTAVLPLISPEKGTQLGFIAQGMLLVVSGVYYPVACCPSGCSGSRVFSPATYTLEGCRARDPRRRRASALWDDLWPLILIGVLVDPARAVHLQPRASGTPSGMGG